MKNERGSALASVTYLVLLLSMITVPLLMFVNQGATNATRNAEGEKAYYAAESGSAILKRALTEAINTSQIRMNEATINTLVTAINNKQLRVNNLPLTLSNLQNTRTVVNGQSLFATEQTTTVAYTFSNRSRTQSSKLRFKVDPGSANTNPYAYNTNSIFGINAVVPNQSMVTNKLQDGSSSTPKNAPQQAITGAEYNNQFNAYFDAQVAARPQPLTPEALTPAPSPPLSNYTLAPGALNINNNRNGAAAQGNISVKWGGGNSNSTLVINGDLISAGDINFQDFQDITINGNLIAGGNINFSNYINNLKVTGSIMTGGSSGFSMPGGASKIDIGGSLTSTSNITMASFNNDMTVGGSILASQTYTVGQGSKLIVSSGEISAKTLTFNGSVGEISVAKSLKARDSISFNASINKFTVGGNVSSMGDVDFNQNVGQLTMPAGSIISGGSLRMFSIGTLTLNGSLSAAVDINLRNTITTSNITGSGSMLAGNDITVNYVDNLHMTGSVSSGRNVTFNNGSTGNFTMGGSIYAPGQLTWPYIAGLSVSGSVYAGSTNMTGTIGTLAIGGTFLSKGELNFKYINKLSVAGFIGSEGQISFVDMGSTPKPSFGGITTPVGVTMPSYMTYPIVLNYNPPGGTAGNVGSNPIVTFDNWGS
uniref:Uncharacterized protein n=2 Tax=Paenibacillus athensensis TaxID=1967502 RepID=A0A4Y8Q7Y1_9BACL